MPAAQIGARASASSIGPLVPHGKRATDRLIMPFNTSVKSRLCAAVGSPTGTTRVMSVVPPRYWPPESISSRPSPSMTACEAWLAR